MNLTDATGLTKECFIVGDGETIVNVSTIFSSSDTGDKKSSILVVTTKRVLIIEL